ncbi:MAG: tetratricopeptide repeat protein [Deltaproteobacteria bacterium]|nr:tetratricopeptide repeat protein [Deltaproteobacteria bacterium]
MSFVKTLSRLLSALVFATIAAGCAGAPSHSDTVSHATLESIRPGFDVVYSPMLRPGQTLDSAKNEIASHLTHIDLDPDDFPPYPLRALNTIVRDDKIEIKWTTQPITPEKTGIVTLPNHRLSKSRIVVEFRREGGGNRRYQIHFPGLVTLKFRDGKIANKVADALLFIQDQEEKREEARAGQLAAFTATAAKYRALSTKPVMSEDQRKSIVQANAFSQQKNYKKAIERYLKAIELDSISYPAAYYNLALLHAQENDFVMAVFYMKHYLLLEPDAKDARSAQDKIYEWELVIKPD